MKIEGCCALITGASAGLGQEFARQLAGRARALVLVARREERLQELRTELTKGDANLKIHVRKADLSNPIEIKALVEWLDAERINVDLLINNAGLGDMGPFATIDLSRLEQILNVNMVALAVLTRQLLPGMIARQRGAVLNVSSSASFLPMAGFAAYAASKAFVTSFSEALHAELSDQGVSVSALCPGPVHTEFMQVAQRRGNKKRMTAPEAVHVSAEAVVRQALVALQRNQPLVIPGIAMKLGMLFVRLTPMSILRLASRVTAKRNQS
jgi:short-subunit dehydrogenase